jgi:hypothetical protein
MFYIENPKTKGSGIIAGIPQTGECPNGCADCFFQSGRSYLHPLEDHLPNMPTLEMAKGRVVRINDGNDSNNKREYVEMMSNKYEDKFFNTAIPTDLDKFSAPVVLTVNPGEMTDYSWYRVSNFNNLMFVRFRTNMWNLDILDEVIHFYANENYNVPVVLTFMAYYTETVPEEFKKYYEWKKRTLNSYWCLKQEEINKLVIKYLDNPLVGFCGRVHACKDCGNCLKYYYAAKERCRKS